MNISISICPASLEFDNGDRYDEQRLLAAIRHFVEQRHPDATISCLQIGHRQGDQWAKVDGNRDKGADLLSAFFERHSADEDLFVGDAGCIDCGDSGTHVRDDWELLYGKRLCCHCASERVSEGSVPQDWQFDGE